MTADVRSAVPLPSRVEVPPWRLLATLGGAGALAGLLIVLAYNWTRPAIEAHRAEVLRAALEEVLRAPARADTIFLVGSALSERAPSAGKPGAVERIYRGVDASGRNTGYAIVASEAGFADQVTLMFGLDIASGEVLGIRVLSSKETPGLGDRIERPSFTAQFARALAPLRGVKDTAAKGSDRGAIVMITGATISSRTVIREINNAVARWSPLIRDFESRPGAVHR